MIPCHHLSLFRARVRRCTAFTCSMSSFARLNQAFCNENASPIIPRIRASHSTCTPSTTYRPALPLASTCPRIMKHHALRCQRNNFSSHPMQSKTHCAFIALGSNMGDRFAMIEQACRLMDGTDSIRVRRTSGLWQTRAMYILDQADFLNGVCEIETTLEPLQLLDSLQQIEKMLQRKKLIDKGPRTIDLDILLYDNDVVEHERLMVPHKSMLDRAFVLQPLSELIPNKTLPHSSKTIVQHLADIPIADRPTSTLTPLSPSLCDIASLHAGRQTHVMSILNLTPDSFSDGGTHDMNNLSATGATLVSHLDGGATIIDIGGQSTRPNAHIIGDEEETSRVVPTIQHLSKLLSSLPPTKQDTSSRYKAAISIDTFRASVARAAVEAGAHIVNDVSAGVLDPQMLTTVAELGCSVILMHMRGDPSTMTSKENSLYPDGLIQTIGAELLERVRAAEAAGVRRWRIMLDPGIGFAKNADQNLEVLRRLGELRAYPGLEGLPWVVGSSRKGFIGKITGVKGAKERVWGSAVAVAAAVQGGADIVRVHDVAEMSQVVKMSDAIWRV